MNDDMKPKEYNLENYVQSPATIAYLAKTKDPDFCRIMHLTEAEKESYMTNKKIMDRITRVCVDHLGVTADKVTPEARINEDLGADSLDHVELVMAFEDEFNVEITDEEAEKIVTVQQAIDKITALTA